MEKNSNKYISNKEDGPPKKPTKVNTTAATAASKVVVRPPLIGNRGGLSDRAGPSTSTAGGSGARGVVGKPVSKRPTPGVTGSTPLRASNPHFTTISFKRRGSASASRFNWQVAKEGPTTSRQSTILGQGRQAEYLRLSKQSYYEKKGASRILFKLGEVAAEQLTEEQAKSLEWANGMGVISDCGKPAGATPKRNVLQSKKKRSP